MMPPPIVASSLVGLACLAVLSTPVPAAAGEFDFSSYQTVPLSLRLRDANGAPLAYARVTVTDRWRRARVPNDGNVFAQVLTDEYGDANCLVRVPRGTRLVDIVITAPGQHGPYTFEKLRRQWGAFAPASRTTRSLSQLGDVDVTLNR